MTKHTLKAIAFGFFLLGVNAKLDQMIVPARRIYDCKEVGWMVSTKEIELQGRGYQTRIVSGDFNNDDKEDFTVIGEKYTIGKNGYCKQLLADVFYGNKLGYILKEGQIIETQINQR